jgi:flagellum-specific peptidoglycan hydrolase FlgJ
MSLCKSRLCRRAICASLVSLLFVTGTANAVQAESVSAWYQNHRATTLWSGPDANAVAFGSVPTWSGFQFLAAQGDRMMVRYLGNGVDHEGGVAWVDRGDVGPTDRPLLWVAAKKFAAMWSGADDQAVHFGDAPENALMVRVAPVQRGKAQVYFLGAEGQAPGLVWVDVADLRPAGAPPSDSPLWRIWGEWDARVAADARRVAEEAQRLKAASLASSAPQGSAGVKPPTVASMAPVALSGGSLAPDQQRFIEEIGGAAGRLRAEIGLPPSLVLAMAINESGWGRSELAQRANNLFGIKAHRGAGTAGIVEMETWEMIDGKMVTVRAPFRAYRTRDECLRDLASFLRSNKRYESVWTISGDPPTIAGALFKAGYATDPAWTEKLARIIDRYGLRRFDA